MRITSKWTETADKIVWERRYTVENYHSPDEAMEAEYAAERYKLPDVGQIYMVACGEDTLPESIQTRLLFRPDNGRGWAGNSNPAIHRYHGWRGTTNDYAVYSYGLRECLEATLTGLHSKRLRVVFGPDMVPDAN